MTRLEQYDGIDRLKRYSRVTIGPHKDHVHSVRWNPEGDRLASGGKDCTVCLHRLTNSALSSQTEYLKGHNGDIDQVCWNPVEAYQLASASIDKYVKVWDCRTTTKSVASTRIRGPCLTACWYNDGNTIAVAKSAVSIEDQSISFIDARSGFKLAKEHKLQFEVEDMTWNKQGDLFFLTSSDGHIHVLNYPDLHTLYVIDAFSSPCVCIRFDPSGKRFAVGSNDAITSLWDMENLACYQVIDRLDWAVKSISFSHDGNYIASSSEDLFIDVAEVDTGEQVVTIDEKSAILTLDFHPKENILAYAARGIIDEEGNMRDQRELGQIKVCGLPEDRKRSH